MNRNLKTLLATGLISLLGICTLAQATENYGETNNIMTGAQCQPSNGTQWADFLVNPNGIRNIHPTYNRYVSCTIPISVNQAVDQSDSDPLTPAGPLYVTLSFDYSQVPVSPATTTTCTFFKSSWTGTVTTTTVGIGGSRQTSLLNAGFGLSVFDGVSPSGLEALSFNCRLPKNVKLAQIYWRQVGRTDTTYYTP